MEACPNRGEGAGGGLGQAPFTSEAAKAGRGPNGPGTNQNVLRAPPRARGRPGQARRGAIEACPNRGGGAGVGLGQAPLTGEAAKAGRGPNGPGTNHRTGCGPFPAHEAAQGGRGEAPLRPAQIAARARGAA